MGVSLGSWVSFRTAGRDVEGQVWMRHASTRYWWIATTDQRFVKMHESKLTVLGSHAEQLTLAE